MSGYETQTTVMLDGGDVDCDVRGLAEPGRHYLTVRCDGHALLRIHYGPGDAAKLVRALATGAHEAMRHAELSCAQWDAVLKGLDALYDTAVGRRAEAYMAEHDDPVPAMLLPTDHVRDGHVEGAS